jgi:hypothetical protein
VRSADDTVAVDLEATVVDADDFSTAAATADAEVVDDGDEDEDEEDF